MTASLILGLSGAICWGVADFLARYTSREVGAYRSLFFMQAFGFGLLCAFWLAAKSPQAPQAAPAAWGWGAVAGILSAAGSLALYRSFATGKLAIVAPISAAYPVLTALLTIASGEQVKGTSWAGIALVFFGVSLTVGAARSVEEPAAAGAAGARGGVPLAPEIAARRDPPESNAAAPMPQGGEGRGGSESARSGVGWALFAAACFGVMYWLLGLRVVPALGAFSAAWVLRLVGAVGLGAVAWPARRSLRVPRPKVLGMLAAIGALDTSAYLCNNLGMQFRHVAVVTVLTSLYAAVTVLLAATFLRERLNGKQWLGVMVIFAGVVLLAV